MKLNEKIILLRNKYQMSQGDLAEKLNVSRQSVSKWETVTISQSCEKQEKTEKRLFQLVVGIIFISFVPFYFIMASLGFAAVGTMRSLVILGYAIMCGLICIFSRKNPVRTILITTGVIVAVYILVIWLDYLARL